METKTKVIIATVAMATSFTTGRFTTPVQIKTVTKTVEVEKIVKDVDTDTKKQKKVVIVVKPDGTKTTTIDEVTDKDQKSTTTTDKDKKTDSTTEKHSGSDSLTTLGVLAGYSSKEGAPVFGVSVYRPVLGPIGIGVEVTATSSFKDPTVAVEIGLSF